MNRPKVTVIEPVTKQLEESMRTEQPKQKVAAYARVSTEQDEQQNSYEAQVGYYEQYIRNNPDWELVSVFADEGITGTSTKLRDGFNRMVSLALNGGIDLILTKSISRFARNTVDTLQTVRKLKAAGVEVIFEKENLHTMDPKCEVMLTIMSPLAQEESRSISENVRWGQQKSMRDGKVSIPYKNFLGYRKGADGRPEIVEEEAETVRLIYRLFLEGETIGGIARHLTENGIPSPTGKKKWHISTVGSILKNEKYKGDALLQKTYTVDYLTKEKRKNNGEMRQYLVERSHDPIIDPEVFDRVQQKLAERSPYRQKIRNSSPLCNKIICGECGAFYGHKVWHNRAGTERYDIWYCNERYKGGDKCSTPTLREHEIKTAFAEALRQSGNADTKFSEAKWRELVENVTVLPERKLDFLLTDGKKIQVAL